MNVDFKERIPPGFANESRVWIYQSDRAFDDIETCEIEKTVRAFASGWTSHRAKVKGFAGLFFERFLIFMADETATGVSGCSTDESVRVVKSIEKEFRISFFERKNLAFVGPDKIKIIALDQLDVAFETGKLQPDTLYFNNTVLTKKELLEKWIVPIYKSWLVKKILPGS